MELLGGTLIAGISSMWRASYDLGLCFLHHYSELLESMIFHLIALSLLLATGTGVATECEP